MAFKLAQVRTIKWPVTVHIPQDAGKTKPATFTAEFEVISGEEQKQVISDDKDLLERQLVGWDESVKDEDGQPLPFNDETKKKMLDITYVRTALFVAIAEFQNGRGAQRKN